MWRCVRHCWLNSRRYRLARWIAWGRSSFSISFSRRPAGHEVEEYRKHAAISLAGVIAKRQVSVKEVLETAIARAEQVNPVINAIVHKQYEQARKVVAAGLPEGPLKGVPYLLKDLGFFETGQPVTFGSSLFGSDRLPQRALPSGTSTAYSHSDQLVGGRVEDRAAAQSGDLREFWTGKLRVGLPNPDGFRGHRSVLQRGMRVPRARFDPPETREGLGVQISFPPPGASVSPLPSAPSGTR